MNITVIFLQCRSNYLKIQKFFKRRRSSFNSRKSVRDAVNSRCLNRVIEDKTTQTFDISLIHVVVVDKGTNEQKTTVNNEHAH